MPRPHKFVPGDKITRITDLVEVILMGLYVYHNGKPMHPSWMRAWPLGTLNNACRSGQFRYALLNEAHPDNFKEIEPCQTAT